MFSAILLFIILWAVCLALKILFKAMAIIVPIVFKLLFYAFMLIIFLLALGSVIV